MFESRRESSVCPVSESVAVAPYGDGGGVMERTIQQRGGQDGIGEDVAPGGIGFVGGQNDGFLFFVAFGDDLEEEGGIVLLQGQITDFIEDRQIRTAQVLCEAVESIFFSCRTRFGDQIIEDEEVDAVACLDGFEHQGDGQMGRPHPCFTISFQQL